MTFDIDCVVTFDARRLFKKKEIYKLTHPRMCITRESRIHLTQISLFPNLLT